MSDLQRLQGIHSVLEALRARRRPLRKLLVRAGPLRGEIVEVVKAAGEAGVPVEEVGPEELARGGGPGGNPQGVALLAGPLPELELEEICMGEPGARTLVALDGVEDPQNVGAIVRVAEAAGASGLVLTRRRAPPLSPALARASAGAIEWLPVARVGNLVRSLKGLKSNGFWVVGAEPHAATSLFRAPDRVLEGDLVVVMGAEGRGLRDGVRALVDHPVRIPTPGRVASLNVATAAAIVLFELVRRRGLSNAGPESA
ncbi:MAG: RNA methyltransferase [Proteobacteria bacterium]|nr:RNA methyltransferase [Pseudomonadota bacterium]